MYLSLFFFVCCSNSSRFMQLICIFVYILWMLIAFHPLIEMLWKWNEMKFVIVLMENMLRHLLPTMMMMWVLRKKVFSMVFSSCKATWNASSNSRKVDKLKVKLVVACYSLGIKYAKYDTFFRAALLLLFFHSFSVLYPKWRRSLRLRHVYKWVNAFSSRGIALPKDA